MHLPYVGMGQATQLQVDDDQAAQLARVVEVFGASRPITPICLPTVVVRD